MAGEGPISKSSELETHPEPKPPEFITETTEFVGKGDIPIPNRRSRSRSGTRITPTVLSISDENFYHDLEEYVKEMTTVTAPTMQGDDVWAQLQQKESDLLLAAELGKALLEKNEELKKEQEKVTEEFSKKVEVSF
ncbi:hypothetical protein O0L34_g15175 [Tuta absoluta]|nr:hypothetical protein O0L34_g15175 [Tuta absoluta]